MSSSGQVPSARSSRSSLKLVDRSMTSTSRQNAENTPPVTNQPAPASAPPPMTKTYANQANNWSELDADMQVWSTLPPYSPADMNRPGISPQRFRDTLEAGVAHFAPDGPASDFQPEYGMIVAVNFSEYETPRANDPRYLQMVAWQDVATALNWRFVHLEIPCGLQFTDAFRTGWLSVELQKLQAEVVKGSMFICVSGHGSDVIPALPAQVPALQGPFIIGAPVYAKDSKGFPRFDPQATTDSRRLLRNFYCDLSTALRDLRSNAVEIFVFVESCYSFELVKTVSPIPILVSAGMNYTSVGCMVLEQNGAIRVDPNTGHPVALRSTVTRVIQMELLRTLEVGDYINAATLSAHLLRCAFQLDWQSAPVLQETYAIGRTSFAFLPSKGTPLIRPRSRLTPTSSNSRDSLHSRAAKMRIYIANAPRNVVLETLADIATSFSLRGLLTAILEILGVRPAGSCEVEFKVDPGLFYSLPKVPGLEFVGWTRAVDPVRANQVFNDCIFATIPAPALPAQPSSIRNPIASPSTVLSVRPARPSTESRRSRVDASYSGAVPSIGYPPSSAGRALVSTNPRTTANLRPGASVNENERPAARNQENKPFAETLRKLSGTVTGTVQKAKRTISGGYDSFRGRPRG